MNAVSVNRAVSLQARRNRGRLGLKGARAAQWLVSQGIAPPAAPNTWLQQPDRSSDALLVARLGTGEFFLEGAAEADSLRRLAPLLDARPSGVYPVLREDRAFLLSGADVHEVLAQVCNVDFAQLPLEARPVIMTMMIGVSVLVVPQSAAGRRYYRIWCDPSFGPYLGESLGAVVLECGGRYTGMSA
jgi:sarcosine oxidase subunit gamma